MGLTAQFRVQPTPYDVTWLNDWFDQKAVASGIESVLAANLKLCLNEVLANLISYGFKNTPHPSVSVEINLRPGFASGTVIDNGDYFDLREWPVPKDRNLLNDAPGGFGIALIKERATRLYYFRMGEFNQLKIVCEDTTA